MTTLPLNCRVTHGANDSYFEIGGRSVASVRRALATSFNIPNDAEALVNGVRVDLNHWLRPGDHVEWVRHFGRKGAFPEQRQPEHWDEDKTPFRSDLFLDASTYRVDSLFDVPPAQATCLSENYLVSPGENFAYQERILLQTKKLRLHPNGVVHWNGDIVIPALLDIKLDSGTRRAFPGTTTEGERVKWGMVWMSMTPMEMLTQRSGVQAAQGTVVIAGLGMGWLLRKVSEKPSVERVIVVEKSRDLLDWFGTALCQRYSKVSDVICDDAYN